MRLQAYVVLAALSAATLSCGGKPSGDGKKGAAKPKPAVSATGDTRPSTPAKEVVPDVAPMPAPDVASPPAVVPDAAPVPATDVAPPLAAEPDAVADGARKATPDAAKRPTALKAKVVAPAVRAWIATQEVGPKKIRRKKIPGEVQGPLDTLGKKLGDDAYIVKWVAVHVPERKFFAAAFRTVVKAGGRTRGATWTYGG